MRLPQTAGNNHDLNSKSSFKHNDRNKRDISVGNVKPGDNNVRKNISNSNMIII